MGNGPACAANLPQTLINNGNDMADPCQLSTIMRDASIIWELSFLVCFGHRGM